MTTQERFLEAYERRVKAERQFRIACNVQKGPPGEEDEEILRLARDAFVEAAEDLALEIQQHSPV